MFRTVRFAVSAARLLLWWQCQGWRWNKCCADGQRYTDGNAYALAEHDLRCRVGALLQAFFPERTSCLECGMPSGLTDSHSVWYSNGSGISAMCGSCWNFLRQYSDGGERIVALHKAFVAAHWDGADDKWPDIEAALRREASHMSHSPIQPSECPQCQARESGGPWLSVSFGSLEAPPAVDAVARGSASQHEPSTREKENNA